MNDNENKTNAPINNLLRCPFCGSEAKLREIENTHFNRLGKYPPYWDVGCSDDTCYVGPFGADRHYNTQDDAIKAWNTRNEADALRAEAGRRDGIEERAKVVKPRCGNCQHGGDHFKFNGSTHLHCQHPDEKVAGEPGWDSLREWYSNCSSWEAKALTTKP